MSVLWLWLGGAIATSVIFAAEAIRDREAVTWLVLLAAAAWPITLIAFLVDSIVQDRLR